MNQARDVVQVRTSVRVRDLINLFAKLHGLQRERVLEAVFFEGSSKAKMNKLIKEKQGC